MDASNTQDSRKMLRTDGAALHVGLSVSTLEKLRLTGDGPEYIKLGRTVVYSPSDLDSWMQGHRRKSTSVAA
ncbi:DNA-binding protein [Mesorhizobium sp. NZP2077]|nr:DNA-binding protein [Mesorhizobium sp. NZP2077]QKD14971.1 helix-turn-helix domain-containing protein [Mesorhizobium sp. NZP2077]